MLMNNNMYICSWIDDNEPEIFCGYVWADHYVLDSDLHQVTFFDSCNNCICLLADVNNVREAYAG